MTFDDAKQIREVFGPCTTIYECSGPDEIQKDNEDFTPQQAAWFEFELEETRLDRQMGVCEDQREWKSMKDFLDELRRRVIEKYGPNPR